ncbi:MAG: bacillithiol biosynthesis cysteine-adding enzyme BshC [Gemmatimonadales bacterium]|jgi:bacillithiol biosynthesis cysteine-adding enzyme BshC
MDAPAFPRLVPRRLASGGTLAGDALAGLADTTGLFAHAPSRRPRPAGSGLADGPGATLAPDVFRRTPAAAGRLEMLLAGEGLAVTTGQQPGLFLGPLYTLYKAVTAVRVAEQVEAATGRPTLAVFWVASDDHDWDEVAACRFLDREEDLVTLRLAPPAGLADRSVGPAPLPERVEQLLVRFADGVGGAVAGTRAAWFADLRSAYRPGRSFGDAFAEALCHALGDKPLAVLDAALPAVRRAATPLYERIVREPDLVIDGMAAGRTAVEAAGYEPNLTPPENGMQIFLDDGRQRRHVLYTGEGFQAADGIMGANELLGRLGAGSTGFSPAAALRPVLESRLLPVAATILGPGEIGYWAQLRPLFDALDVPMPAIAPRDAWMLVEPAMERLLDKLDLEADQVEREGKGIDDRWISAARPPAVRSALDALDGSLAEGFDGLAAAVERELPGITSAVGKARHLSTRALEEFSRTVDARVREREAVALGQADRLRRHLLPDGRPQERVLAAAQFLARYGNALVDALLDASRVAGAEGQD